MARIRTLKPEFWGDEKLAPLEPIHRLVFLGLVSQADDAGRLIDNVKHLDGLLFPETGDSCAESLVVLARLSRILRYTSASGQRLVQILNWERHQKVDKPSRYTLPAPTREDVARQSRDSRAPTLDLGPTTYDLRPGTDDPRANKTPSPLDELIAYVGEDYRGSVEAVSKMRKTGASWAMGFLATWIRDSMESSFVPQEDRPTVLALALLRYATDADSWSSPYFRSFVRTAHTDFLAAREARRKDDAARATAVDHESWKAREQAEIERLNREARERATGPPGDPQSLIRAVAGAKAIPPTIKPGDSRT